MDNEQLVALVIKKVREALAEEGTQQEIKQDGGISLLVALTGGITGYETAREQMVQVGGVRLVGVASQGALYLHDSEVLRQHWGFERVITPPDLAGAQKAAREAAALVLPVLTMNTAAKLAHGIGDNAVGTLTLHTLLMGKPVIACRNAADPETLPFKLSGWNRGQAALGRRLRDNLKMIEEMGVTLVPAGQLAATVKAALPGAGPGLAGSARNRVITRDDVMLAKKNGAILQIPAGTIVTDLARETANTEMVQIVFD